MCKQPQADIIFHMVSALKERVEWYLLMERGENKMGLSNMTKATFY